MSTSALNKRIVIFPGPNGADLDPLWTHEEISKNKTWSVRLMYPLQADQPLAMETHTYLPVSGPLNF